MASVPLPAARQMVADRLAEGDADGALALARQIHEHYPRDRRTSLLAGRAQLARGDTSAARLDLELAAAAFPDSREVWSGLDACGASERAALLLAELPPLPAVNGERPAISAAALGHLYLRQLLLTHCTAQLEPVWRGDSTRLDVGVALAEAHWRLGETSAAADVCRALLSAAPDCLTANLILAQQLWSAGGQDEARTFMAAAEAVDPENGVAEELYEWLIVRDSALAPLRGHEVVLDLADTTAEQAALEVTPAQQVEEPIREPLTGIGGLLGGIAAIQEPIPEPRPFWERPRDIQSAEEPKPIASEAASAGEPVTAVPELEPWSAPSAPEDEPSAIEAAPAGEPVTAIPDAELSTAWPAPQAEPLAGEAAAPGEPVNAIADAELSTGWPAPQAELRADEPAAPGQPVIAAPESESWLAPPAPQAETVAPAEPVGAIAEAELWRVPAVPEATLESEAVEVEREAEVAPVADAESETSSGVPPEWERPSEVLPEFDPVTAAAQSEPDLALTSPEPALAAAEAMTERAPALRWVEVSGRGHVIEMRPPVGEARTAGWIECCGQVGERLSLGALRASSIESARGVVQLLHEQGAVTVALAPSGANLGLVRSSLRRSHQTTEEHNPS